MKDLEYQAIEILKSGEPLPVDIYIELNNSGIDPEYLITIFSKKEDNEIDEDEDDGLDPIQKEIINQFKSYQYTV
tara:strand:+ start:1705 stop:1929 length:225 start_codon:yes stop_codon:yes gene_type:complete